jgi:hypothetical protein
MKGGASVFNVDDVTGPATVVVVAAAVAGVVVVVVAADWEDDVEGTYKTPPNLSHLLACS